MFKFCSMGGDGIGWNAESQTFSAVCGSFEWSKRYGGVDSDDVGDFFGTPLNTDGNSEWVTCSGDGYGVLDDGTAVSPVPSCLHAGERVKTNFMADAMIAQELVRPNPGQCVVYMPVMDGYNQTLYEHSGCGIHFDDTPNPCPVLRPPYDTHPQREVQIFGAKRWCWEGKDTDGGLEPITADADMRQVGAWAVWNGGLNAPGAGGGTQHADGGDYNDEDPNGDGIRLTGLINFGGIPGEPNRCIPVSTTDPSCDTAAQVSRPTMALGLWGATTQMISGPNSTYVCVGDNPTDDGPGAEAGGVCMEDKRIPCTTGNAYCRAGATPWACCTGDGTGTCDARTSTTAGGCDFGAGGDYGPCYGIAETLEQELKRGTSSDGVLRKDLRVVTSIAPCNLDNTSCAGGNYNYSTLGYINSDPGAGGGGACSTDEAQTIFNTHSITAGLWPFQSSYFYDPLGTNEFGVVDDNVLNNYGGGSFGGNFRVASWYGRVAGDTEASGQAHVGVTCAAHNVTTMCVPDDTFTANEHRYKTLILRPDHPWSWEDPDCLVTNDCQEAREIAAHTEDDIVVQTAFTDAPADDDYYRISAASCTRGNNDGTIGENACDAPGAIIRVWGTEGGEFADFSIWYGSSMNDGGGGSKNFQIHNGLVRNHELSYLSDMSEVHMHDVIIDNAYNQGSSLFRIGFGGASHFDHLTIKNSTASHIISEGFAAGTTIRNLNLQNIYADDVINVGASSMMLIDGVVGNGVRGALLRVAPINDYVVANLTLRNCNIYGFGNYTQKTTYPKAMIVYDDNLDAGDHDGDIANNVIENCFAVMDTELTGADQPMLVGLEHPGTSDAEFTDHYDQLTIKNSGVYRTVQNKNCTGAGTPWACCGGAGTGTCLAPKIACTYDSNGGLTNVGCENAGSFDAGTLTTPPVMIGNTVNGMPTADFPYQCAPAARLAHIDSDDYLAGFKVCITDDDGACADTDGVLDGGDVSRTICVTDGAGDWAVGDF